MNFNEQINNIWNAEEEVEEVDFRPNQLNPFLVEPQLQLAVRNDEEGYGCTTRDNKKTRINPRHLEEVEAANNGNATRRKKRFKLEYATPILLFLIFITVLGQLVFWLCVW